jgi:membrane associated rhomboid family serine protease
MKTTGRNILQSVKIIFSFLLIIWGIYLISLVFPLQQYGLVPRSVHGLAGIITAPLLHASWTHLIGNSITFTIFALLLALLEAQKMFVKVFLITLIGGILTWLMGRTAVHIGASGLIFGLWGYIILSGWFSRQLKYILASIILIFFYSGLIFGIFPREAHISWESHLFGFIAGVLVSWLYHKK